MRDLSQFKGCPAPQPVTLEGRFVTAVPFDRAAHQQALWDALGGLGTNELIKYFPNEPFADAATFSDWIESMATSLQWVTLVFIENATSDVVGMATYMRPRSEEWRGRGGLGCPWAEDAALAACHRSPLSDGAARFRRSRLPPL